MSNPIPDPETIAKFQCEGSGQSLTGGEGFAIQVGDCVFKPVNNPERYNWSSELLTQLPLDGYRISMPIRSTTGSFVHNGWAASVFEPGAHGRGNWQERIRISRLFHKELDGIDASPMPPSEDRWSQAHEIAWQVLSLPTSVHLEMKRKIEDIFDYYEPVLRGNRIIHADLCGNFLFEDGSDPCIIDFSPAYGSFEYAEAILVADATAWESAPLDIVNLIAEGKDHRQNLLRAINFRIIVAALFQPDLPDRFLAHYAEFSPLINLLIG
jgi:uncharacterized protein (TIGR02569 family)